MRTHVRIVECYVGQMCCQQGINTATGTHQKHLRVYDAGAEGTRKDTSQIDDTNSRRAVHNLQGDAKEQLYDDIESQMEPVRMQEHIAKETPDL